ncbi:MAG TPA: Ig-like domain-containing protein, partial [Gemmatimonadaceae bacterium]|nr:Ig-like domain-containing protein [Gemmatimonadaceae bacterium]
MRTFILAVTGFLFIVVAACSSYGTSVVEVENQQAQVASVSIALPSPSLVAGQTQRGQVIVKDATGAALSGRAVTWFSSSTSIATVNDSGVIAAVTPGAA